MCDFFNEKTEFKAYLSGDSSLEIEIDRENPVMEVLIKDSSLTILPYTDDFLEVFTLILSFIAKHHQEIINELRDEETHKIQKPSEVDENEDDSDDDYEWI